MSSLTTTPLTSESFERPAARRGKDKPLYQVMKKDLEQSIRSGRFEPGSRVPSESQLIAQYHVSSTTARRCLDELEHEGLLFRVRGKGTFVSDFASILRYRQVAVLVKDLFSLSHPFISQVLGAIERITEGSEAHLSVQRIPSLPDPEMVGRTLVSGLRHHRTDYALVLSNVPLVAIQPLMDAGIHCLGVNTRYQDDRIPYISLDFEAALVKTLRAVLRMGHRRIALLTMEPALASAGVMNSSSFIHSSWAAVRDELPELSVDPLIVPIPHPAGDHLTQAVEQMMASSEAPTVMICWDEVAGLEVVRHLRKIGYNVPGDVSVVGNKLLPSSELAVVETPLLEMATAAAHAMLHWVSEGRTPRSRLFPPGEILPRETLAPPASTEIV